MSNFDDIFSSQGDKPRWNDQPFDKEAWAAKKQEERKELYALADSTATEVSKDGDKFRQYLDVQSRFSRYTPTNALLILAQMPEATQLKDFDGWKEAGVSVQRKPKSVKILEPGKEYDREDGTRGTSFEVKRVYDVSQTRGRVRSAPAVKLDDRVLLKALIHRAPVPIQTVDSLPNNMGALYDHSQQVIFVCRGMGAEDIFRSVSKELAHAESYVKAVQACGVAACAKHFPGDGVDYRDQHLHPSVNSLHADRWYDSYGKVYENLIAGGLMSVMVGHIAQPYVAMDVDPELTFEEAMLPATLSRPLLTGVLRGKYGFNGVITSDATIMGGYTMAMERRKAIPASIMAGCDMLVFNTDFEEDYRYILDALDNGSLTMERLEEAVTRILALKAKVCRKAENAPVPAAQWHAEAADKAITLVKNTQPEKLPMTPKRYPSIRLVTLGKDEIQDGSVREITKQILEENGFRVELYDPFADDLHGSGRLPSDRLTLYMANFEQASNQTVVRIQWCPKHALDIPRFRLSALNSTGLDVVKVHFIGQRKMYNNGTVKVVPLCIRRKQQANPSRRP